MAFTGWESCWHRHHHGDLLGTHRVIQLDQLLALKSSLP